MIEALSYKLAAGLKKRVPDHPASVDVLAYAFNFSLNTLITLMITLLSAVLLNQVWEVLIVLFSFALLRMISGGYHFKSAAACIVFSAVMANVIPFVVLPDHYILWINGAALVLALLFAPSQIEDQTRIPKKYFPLLKLASAGLISLNFIIASPLAAMSFFVQGISLTIRKGGFSNEEEHHAV